MIFALIKIKKSYVYNMFINNYILYTNYTILNTIISLVIFIPIITKK